MITTDITVGYKTGLFTTFHYSLSLQNVRELKHTVRLKKKKIYSSYGQVPQICAEVQYSSNSSEERWSVEAAAAM